MAKPIIVLVLLGVSIFSLFGTSYAFETTVFDGHRARDDQILTHEKVTYSDPNVNTGYSSDPQFKPKGMQHVYTITHAFLDLVQRKDVLPASINVTQILTDDFWDAPSSEKEKRISEVSSDQNNRSDIV